MKVYMIGNFSSSTSTYPYPEYDEVAYTLILTAIPYGLGCVDDYPMPISKPRHRYGRGPARILPVNVSTAQPRKQRAHMIRDGP